MSNQNTTNWLPGSVLGLSSVTQTTSGAQANAGNTLQNPQWQQLLGQASQQLGTYQTGIYTTGTAFPQYYPPVAVNPKITLTLKEVVILHRAFGDNPDPETAAVLKKFLKMIELEVDPPAQEE